MARRTESPTKGNIIDESLLIPMLIRYPGKIRPCEDKLLFSAPDIFPTLMGLLGVTAERPPTQGIDYSGLFTEDPDCTVQRPTSALFAMQVGGKTVRLAGIRKSMMERAACGPAATRSKS